MLTSESKSYVKCDSIAWSKLFQQPVKFSFQENTSLWFPKLELRESILILDLMYLRMAYSGKMIQFLLLHSLYNVHKNDFLIPCSYTRAREEQGLGYGISSNRTFTGAFTGGQAEECQERGPECWTGRGREALSERKEFDIVPFAYFFLCLRRYINKTIAIFERYLKFYHLCFLLGILWIIDLHLSHVSILNLSLCMV